MKTRVQLVGVTLAVGLLILSTTLTFAQKQTKEEKALAKEKAKEEKALAKEWKKKLSELNPLDYKKMVEDYDSAKVQLSSAQSELATKSTELDQLKTEVESLKKTAADEAAANVTSTGNRAKKASANGVVFKVQIGSFRNKDLTKYFDNNPNFGGEVDSDGTKKYTLGYFSEYWEADTFKKYLREMGVNDAWVVPYKNGQRVNIKDVLEGAI